MVAAIEEEKLKWLEELAVEAVTVPNCSCGWPGNCSLAGPLKEDGCVVGTPNLSPARGFAGAAPPNG